MDMPARLSRRSAMRWVGHGGFAASVAAMGLAAAPTTARADDDCQCGAGGGSECRCLPTSLRVPSATLNTLPDATAEDAGELRYLTDYDRGLWLSQDDQWISLQSHVFDVRAYGATGDGETDDWGAFQRAIEAMGVAFDDDSSAPFGQTLFVPPGVYRLNQSLVVNRAIRIMGSGAGGRFADSILRFDGDLAGVIIEATQPGRTGENPGRRGDGAIVERLRIESIGATPPTVTEGGSSPALYGVWLRTVATVRNCAVVGFAGDGIRVQGPSDVPAAALGGWHVESCEVSNCGGHGLGVSRGSGGVCSLLIATDNGRWGIADDSELGNAYLQCRTAGNGQGAYTTTGEANRSLLLSCASAAGQGRSSFVQATLVVGGEHDANFAGGNAWTATGARMLLQAQEPGATEPALPTAPTLAMRGATGQAHSHVLVTDAGDGRIAELDTQGRLFLGPTGPAITTEGMPIAADPTAILLNLIHPDTGQAGVRWVVPGENGGSVAQAVAFLEQPGPDAPGAQAGRRLTFQSFSVENQIIDTLTLRDGRVGMGTIQPAPTAILDLSTSNQGFLPPRLTADQRNAINAPPEGLMIYNLSSSRLNVFDGENWRELTVADLDDDDDEPVGG